MSKQEEIDTGKFFRGLAKVGDTNISTRTIKGLLELDDRLLGYNATKTKKRGIMATLKHWWRSIFNGNQRTDKGRDIH